MHFLKQVQFRNPFADEVKFDENGDVAAMYDLVNWQLNPNGEMDFITVGKFDETTHASGKKLQIQEQDILWNGNQTKVKILIEQKYFFRLFFCLSQCMRVDWVYFSA